MRQLSTRDRTVSFLLRTLLRLLSATWRYREEIAEGCGPVVRGERSGVLAFLHGKMMPVWYRFRGGNYTALVSSSRDGQLLSDYLEKSLRYRRVIRGSSSKGGSAALRTMIRTLAGEEGPLLVTPDGPRGPAGIPKQGSLVSAIRTGKDVVVVTWRAERVWRAKSWDRMEIPFPFSKIHCRYCTLTLPDSHTQSPDSAALQELLERFRILLNDDAPLAR